MSPARTTLIRAIVALLLLGAAAIGALVLSERPNPAVALQTFLDALDESDERAFETLSGRFRARGSMERFQRSLSHITELRSATQAYPAPSLTPFASPDEVFFCTTLVEPEGVELKVRVLWEGALWGGEWRVDNIARGVVQLDYLRPINRRCPAVR
ncbi:MAG: hypothetical protein AAF411_24550 [Myxococcota bacterium]